MLLAGLAIAIKTRPSFVLVVFMLAYIAVGLAETIFIRPHPPAPEQLPLAIRAELEADEALELDDVDDEKDDKAEGDEYI
jgi:CDP-diacylglycerol--serine O-phosphatidyltransferase